MPLSFLPNAILLSINRLEKSKLYQIRLRKNQKISVVYNNKVCFLGKDGLAKKEKEAITCEPEYIDYIIDYATEKSIYAYNEKIINGFLTLNNGVRIGLAGECVVDKGKVITIKNFSSLNIRIPHEIINCSKNIFPKIYKKGKVYNTLIISAPFCGKTTILKDLVRKFNLINKYSLLVIDERDEFSTVYGNNIDVIKYSTKNYGFNVGLRSLSPNIVITDELSTLEDWNFCKNASLSGVKIIASCHANSISDVIDKNYFIKGVFERYVILKDGFFGKLDCVYDKDYKHI